MKKFLFFLFIIFLYPYSGNTAIRTALVSGDWETPATWSGGVIPTCGDSVVIPVGKTVTITSQDDYSGCGAAMAINIFGELTFQSGKKLDLACGSQIYVQSGGSITSQGGGGNANLINICGSTAWNSSMGAVTGPATVTQGGVQPLPVTVIYFDARIEAGTTVFNWATATETNNDHFEIEKSTSGVLFESIANVNAAGSGTSMVTQKYTYIYLSSDEAYYRLKQVDKNGTCKLYSIVQAVPVEVSQLAVMPNPAVNDLNISVGDDYLNGTVQIVNGLGQQIYSGSVGGYNTLVDITFLNAGIYYLIVDNGESRNTTKIAVRK